MKTNQEALIRYLADNASASVECDGPELIEGRPQDPEGGGTPSLARPVILMLVIRLAFVGRVSALLVWTRK